MESSNKCWQAVLDQDFVCAALVREGCRYIEANPSRPYIVRRSVRNFVSVLELPATTSECAKRWLVGSRI